jgi:hypothetical protein
MDAGSEPTVSVVIGSNGPPESLAACLESLEPQRDGVEVLVQEGRPSPAELRDRFPWADFAFAPDQLVPEHWRDGIDRASGKIVALTIAPMIPAPDWIATIRELGGRYEAFGGAIEPGGDLRLVDWAEYFCRYARDMPPFPARESHDLPGDNAGYVRARLGTVREVYRDGFWEPDVHRRLSDDGVILWQAPELVAALGRSTGFAAFVQQRIEHGRSHGRQRGAHRGKGHNLLRMLISPLVPFVLTLRVTRLVLGKGRHRARLAAALPLVFVYNLAWGLAEGIGYADELRGR